MNKSSLQPKRKSDVADSAVQNAILLALPAADFESVFRDLEFVLLPTHVVLQESGRAIQSAYFLNGGLASELTVMANGKSVEVGLAGKEGFVGVPLLAGLSTGLTRVVMQVGGSGFRISAPALKKLLASHPKLEKGLLRHAQTMAMQASQVAACNKLHAVEKRLARWLLMSQDRLGGNAVPLTQQYLAHMLGTRRASVSVAAAVLQKAGLITYNRGHVTIKLRRKLEASTCECYRMIEQQSSRWAKESA